VQRQEIGVGKQTLVEATFTPGGESTGGTLQLQMLQTNRVPGDERIHPAAAAGIEGPGSSLPHRDVIQRAFGRHNITGITAHVGGPAAEATDAMGAEAYATGDHVAFGGAPSLHTAAHEAAHVVQQSGGVQLKNGVGVAGDPHEQHADQVADRVVAGRSAEDLLDAYAPNSNAGAPAPAVQRQTGSGAAAAGAQPGTATSASVAPAAGDRTAHLIQLLTSRSPAAGGDPAVAYLNALDTPDLLSTIGGVVECGYAPQLHARLASARPFLVAALYAVELARVAPIAPNHPLLQRAGAALDLVSRDQQIQILAYLLHHRGVSVEATTLVEGVLAMRAGADRDTAAASREQLPTGAGRGAADAAGAPDGDEQAVGAAIGASVAGGAAPAPISPGPWAPSGNQPGGLYIGTEAHNAIAGSYRAAHVGDRMFFNHSPLSSILEVFETLARRKVNPAALAEDELARRPDIANISRRHLYEIKPATAQAEAAAQARMYLSLFERAGVDMSLGPMGEPGTSGGLPGPAGVFMFQSPEPGVITYEYRRGRLVPVPVAQPEPATARRWRWELQPLTPMQKQAIVTTTVGGAMLLIIMIILSPVGA
jgi:hypothetical protein